MFIDGVAREDAVVAEAGDNVDAFTPALLFAKVVKVDWRQSNFTTRPTF